MVAHQLLIVAATLMVPTEKAIKMENSSNTVKLPLMSLSKQFNNLIKKAVAVVREGLFTAIAKISITICKKKFKMILLRLKNNSTMNII